MFQIAQVHVSALFNDNFEGRIINIKESPRHVLHPFAYRCRAHDQLLFNVLPDPIHQMLLHQLANRILLPSIKERVQFINDKAAQVTDKKLISISPILSPVERGGQAIDTFRQFSRLNPMTLP